ncbi:MAG: hypothetical protein GEU26_12025 [Nitrososphaeraceae archaeon]|nr:hypothetical protein [Nitrososphaeraceae archaeon]
MNQHNNKVKKSDRMGVRLFVAYVICLLLRLLQLLPLLLRLLMNLLSFSSSLPQHPLLLCR